MLILTFSRVTLSEIKYDYIVSNHIYKRDVQGNFDANIVKEYRINQIYGYKIWLKLEQAGLISDVLNGKIIQTSGAT